MIAAALTALILSTVSGSVMHVLPQQKNAPNTEIDLAHWGFTHPEEIGFLSLGILHTLHGDDMVVYEVRKEKPAVKSSEPPRGRIPEFEGESLLIADFNEGNVNRLGGYFNSFAKSPSRAAVTIDRLSEGDRVLTFVFTREVSGFAGFWIHLFDFKSPPHERVFLDASPFDYITFSIRGDAGGEALALQAADRIWEEKEDSLPIGTLADFLPAGKVTQEWQRAWVPLSNLPQRIDRRELASLVFQGERGGGRVYLRDLAFTLHKGSEIQASTKPQETEMQPAIGMWLWETTRLLDDEDAQARLIQFCREQKITDLFLQLPYQADKESGKWIVTWDKPAFRVLLAGLHDAGLICHALDGAPHFALSDRHDRVLATMASIVRYNRESSPEARFDAVRYDIEPYILPQFAGVQKQAIIRQYLVLLKDLKDMASAAGLKIGADIPFWYDARSRFFEPVAEIQGRPLSEKILEIVDNIGIMDYRTKAYGADGTIAQAVNELRAAERLGKKVFVGLETVALPDETILDFQRGRGSSHIALQKIEGTRVRLVWHRGEDEGDSGEGPRLYQSHRIEVPATRITFHNLSRQDFNDVMQKTAREFSRYASFYGFAVHSYESFRPWLEEREKRTYAFVFGNESPDASYKTMKKMHED